jgi:hypothetical protein
MQVPSQYESFCVATNTKDLMYMRIWQVERGPLCVRYNRQQPETNYHLFCICPFASSRWDKIQI